MRALDALEDALHNGEVTPQIAADALAEVQAALRTRAQFLSEPGAIEAGIGDIAAVEEALRKDKAKGAAGKLTLAAGALRETAQGLSQADILEPELHQLGYVIAALNKA